MKRLLKVLMIGCALIGVAGLTSCSYTEQDKYFYTVEGLIISGIKTDGSPVASDKEFMAYMDQYHMLDPMFFSNEAGTHSAARELNNDEAAIVFWDRWRLYNFNLPQLRETYREAGYESVRAEFWYALTREDGTVLLWERAYFDWPDLD